MEQTEVSLSTILFLLKKEVSLVFKTDILEIVFSFLENGTVASEYSYDEFMPIFHISKATLIKGERGGANN